MNDDIQKAKTLVLNWQKSMENANADQLSDCFSEFMAETYLWRGMHPFHEQYGSDSVIEDI